MRDEFVKWETAYKRYRHWGDLGLWPDILADSLEPSTIYSSGIILLASVSR